MFSPRKTPRCMIKVRRQVKSCERQCLIKCFSPIKGTKWCTDNYLLNEYIIQIIFVIILLHFNICRGHIIEENLQLSEIGKELSCNQNPIYLAAIFFLFPPTENGDKYFQKRWSPFSLTKTSLKLHPVFLITMACD